MGGLTARKAVSGGANSGSSRGAVGERIFQQVEALTANGAMKRTAAIAQVAQEVGSQPGTVAANYYRVARKRGVTLQPRGRRQSSATPSGRSAGSLTAALRTIETALRAQTEELAALRREAGRLGELRRLLK